MVKINEKNLVEMAIEAKIALPVNRSSFDIDWDGKPFSLPGIGGITLNIQIGDSVYGWEADHIEPGVSCCLDIDKRADIKNRGFNFYACSGNSATIISATDKKIVGKKGTVIGHHGGAEHVIIDFPQEVLKKMTYKDVIMINAIGQGLKITDYPDIYCYNLSPRLIKALNPKSDGDKLKIPVAALVPGEIMGSGIGSIGMTTGDYDICTMDRDYIVEHKLDNLSFGDIVAIENHDNRYGRSWRRGAVSIGIIVHGDCRLAGHGPGVTTLMSDISGVLKPIVNSSANIGKLLKIGRYAVKENDRTK